MAFVGIQLVFLNGRITPSEIATGQKRMKIKIIKGKDKTPQTKFYVLIQARNINTNEVIAEYMTNNFTIRSHARYLEEPLQNQRRSLHHIVDSHIGAQIEREQHPSGFALSYLGSQQVSGRILTGQFVRFPILYFGNALREDASARVEVTLIQIGSCQSPVCFPLLGEEFLHNHNEERDPGCLSELQPPSSFPEYQDPQAMDEIEELDFELFPSTMMELLLSEIS